MTLNADTIADLSYKVQDVAELFDAKADEIMEAKGSGRFWADYASQLHEVAETLDNLATEFAEENE